MKEIRAQIGDFLEYGATPFVQKTETVQDAIEVMKKWRIGCVLVVESEKLEGIFTERDLLRLVVEHDGDVAGLNMEQVMTPNPQTIGPEGCITYAINKMAVGGFRSIPVVDRDNRVRSVLSIRDVVGHLSEVFSSMDGRWEEDETDHIWIDEGGG
jgi:CBS domain-containing protein